MPNIYRAVMRLRLGTAVYSMCTIPPCTFFPCCCNPYILPSTLAAKEKSIGDDANVLVIFLDWHKCRPFQCLSFLQVIFRTKPPPYTLYIIKGSVNACDIDPLKGVHRYWV